MCGRSNSLMRTLNVVAAVKNRKMSWGIQLFWQPREVMESSRDFGNFPEEKSKLERLQRRP